jgi:hypothetical protein
MGPDCRGVEGAGVSATDMRAKLLGFGSTHDRLDAFLSAWVTSLDEKDRKALAHYLLEAVAEGGNHDPSNCRHPADCIIGAVVPRLLIFQSGLERFNLPRGSGQLLSVSLRRTAR